MSRIAALTLVAVLGSSAPARAQEAPLKVTVTMKPIHALVLQVMDGAGVPTLIVDGASSPHTYSLKPSDAKALNDADVVFRVSEAIEPFTAKAVRGLPKSVQVVTLETAPGVTRLPRRTSGNFETKGGGAHKGHDHDQGKAGSVDGHIWLDPDNGKAIVAQIAKVLSDKRPASAETFKANAGKATARLDALSRELETSLKPAVGKPYVIFHDALQYFEARFGLTAVGAVTADPEVPPSGKRLVDLRKKVSTLGATCVFSEPTFETRVGQSIVEGTQARIGQLDPEGILVPKGPDAYDMVLRGLAKSLTSCLAAPS
jgi:zinc transport system substrate-binding protein